MLESLHEILFREKEIVLYIRVINLPSYIKISDENSFYWHSWYSK